MRSLVVFSPAVTAGVAEADTVGRTGAPMGAAAPSAARPPNTASRPSSQLGPPRSDGRQGGHSRRPRGARARVLLVVRGLLGGRAWDPAPATGTWRSRPAWV